MLFVFDGLIQNKKQKTKNKEQNTMNSEKPQLTCALTSLGQTGSERRHLLPTFHYNASKECAQILSTFASEHRDDKNKQFKLAWGKWILEPDVAEILSTESNQLRLAGYESDPMEKMYFSARYYYRKKLLKEQHHKPDDETPKKRKKYESADKNMLEKINEHIADQLFNDIAPAKAFKHFCETRVEGRLCIADFDETKIKKIYKNRFFVMRKKFQEQCAAAALSNQ